MNSMFENPGALWALLGIAVPIWLHWYERKSKNKVYFSDLRMFSSLQQMSKGKRNWENLLLLFIRILLLLCLVFAFAKPKRSTLVKTEPSSTSSFLYLDNHPSFLMEWRKEFLSIQHQLSSQFKEVHFIRNDFQANDYQKVLVPKLITDWSSLMPSLQVNQHANVLKHLDDITADESKRLSKQIVWISDFPQNKTLPSFNSKDQVFLRPIPHAKKENIIVDSIWISDGYVQEKQKFHLKVKLKYLGTDPVKNGHSIRFYLESFLLSNQKVDFSKNATVDLDFQVSLPRKGAFEAYFLLDDAIGFDNKYHVILRTSRAQKVLFVSDSPANNVLKRVFDTDSLFTFEHISKEQFLSKNTYSEVFFIFQGIENFTVQEWKSVERQWQLGKSMILIPRSKSNQQAIAYLNKLGLNASLDESAVSHPLSQPTFGKDFYQKILKPQSWLNKLLLWNSVISWKIPKDPNASYLSTLTGNSFLEKVQKGKAGIFVFAADVLLENNSFNRHGLFLPIFQEIVLQNSISEPVAVEYSQKHFSVFPPNNFLFKDVEKDLIRFKRGEKEIIPAQTWQGDHWVCTLPTAEETDGVLNGFYDVISNGNKIGKVAINFPKTESLTQFFSSKELKDYYKGEKNIVVLEEGQKISFSATNPISAWSYAKILFWIAFLMFIIEVVYLIYRKRIFSVARHK
jgi:hypothetical protein